MQPFYFYFSVVFEEVDKKPSKLFFSHFLKEKKTFAKFSIVFFLASLYTIILYGNKQALTNNLSSIVTTLSILFCSVLFLLVVVKNIYLSSIIV